MTDQTPPEPNPGSDRSPLADVVFFVVVCLIIVGFAAPGIVSERTASNPPVQTGQNTSLHPLGHVE
jgi:hypothetical protein